MISTRRIAVVGSNDYSASDFVRSTIRSIPDASTLILTGYCGINKLAREVATARSLTVVQVRWDCKPRLILEASPTAILIFYDASTSPASYLEDLALAARAACVPVAMFDNSGKPLAFRANPCVTVAEDSTTVAIIDQAVDSVRDTFTTKVKVTITLPEAVHTRYEEQARAERIPTDKCMADRLRRCVDHTASRSLYFNDTQRADLERITGGHVIQTPDMALTHIRTTCAVRINDIDITLAPKVLQRAEARAKSCRVPVEKWLEREIVQGLERSTGIRPY